MPNDTPPNDSLVERLWEATGSVTNQAARCIETLEARIATQTQRHEHLLKENQQLTEILARPESKGK
mgnify:CR=1 FL=1